MSAAVAYKADAVNSRSTSRFCELIDGSLVCMNVLSFDSDTYLRYRFQHGSSADRHRIIKWVQQQIKSMWRNLPRQHKVLQDPKNPQHPQDLVFQALRYLNTGGQAAVSAVQLMKAIASTDSQPMYAPDSGNRLVMKVFNDVGEVGIEYASQEMALMSMELGDGELW